MERRGGKIRTRIPPIKLIASAITIGSGGSAGREGLTAQIAAGFGSWLGNVLHLDEHGRRIAMAAGVGAGIGSIFKAPFGGALLSAEILYNQNVPGRKRRRRRASGRERWACGGERRA